MEKGTISVCFVKSALQGVEDRGLDPAPLLRKSGIPATLLETPQARVTPDVYSALLRHIAQILDDEFFGQDSRRMKVGSFAMLCRSVVHGATLERAFDRMVRFFGLILDDVTAQIERDGPIARLVLTPTGPGLPRHIFAYETLLMFMHGLACWLVRRRIPILRADFSYPRPPHSGEYHLLYSSRLRFDQPRTAILFESGTLDLPTRQDETTVKALLRHAPENILVKYKNISSDGYRVRRILRQNPPADWPDFEVLAARLGTSPSTLRRHLRQEGQSYRSIKDQVRRDMAITYLGRPRLSVTDIAAELGFAEPSAFHRAFKKWTGLRPGEYRRRQGHQPPP